MSSKKYIRLYNLIDKEILKCEGDWSTISGFNFNNGKLFAFNMIKNYLERNKEFEGKK